MKYTPFWGSYFTPAHLKGQIRAQRSSWRSVKNIKSSILRRIIQLERSNVSNMAYIFAGINIRGFCGWLWRNQKHFVGRNFRGWSNFWSTSFVFIPMWTFCKCIKHFAGRNFHGWQINSRNLLRICRKTAKSAKMYAILEMFEGSNSIILLNIDDFMFLTPLQLDFWALIWHVKRARLN